MINLDELNVEERQALSDIMDKGESAWTASQIAHLRARASYLDAKELERLERAEAAHGVAVAKADEDVVTAAEVADEDATPTDEDPRPKGKGSKKSNAK